MFYLPLFVFLLCLKLRVSVDVIFSKRFFHALAEVSFAFKIGLTLNGVIIVGLLWGLLSA